MKHKKYALIIVDAFTKKGAEEFDKFLINFLNLIKSKKEVRLLPKILKEIEIILENKRNSNRTKIILKDKSDFQKLEGKINNYATVFNLDDRVEIIEDKNIIGGFILKNKKKKIDNSYKKKLSELYSKIIS